MSSYSESPERAEAQRVAGALVGFIADGDSASASELLNGCSRQVLAQACADLARWITYLVGEDRREEFRARLAEELRRALAEEP